MLNKEIKNPIIRIVEHTKVINWDLLCKDGVDGDQYREKLISQLNCFFEEFEGYRIKIGKEIIINDKKHIPETFKFIKERKIENPTYNPFGINCSINSTADDVIDALKDEESNAIWLQGGGNPGDVDGSENYITKLIYDIHTKTINLKVNSPKPMIGYCFAAPLLFYLSARNLAIAVHGPVAHEILSISKEITPILKKIFTNSFENLKFSGLAPCNESAKNMVHGTKIKGLVLGGLLQIVINSLKSVLSVEKELCTKLISDKSIILFVELLDFGNEISKGKELLEIILKNSLDVKAFALGYTIPNSNKRDEPNTKLYLEGIDNALLEIGNICEPAHIPVSKGLRIGHNGTVNEPVIFGDAEAYFNASQNVLEVNYVSKTLKILDIEKHLLWSKKQLEKENINTDEINETKNNVSELLCTIF